MNVILIVDDAKDIRRMLVSRLTKLGYEVKAVPSGIQALEMLADEDIDLILLDHDMIDMDGIETMEQIKETINLPPPVIMMTAYSSLHLAVTFMKVGGVDYVEKPFDFDVLNVKIRRAIELSNRLKKEIADRKQAEKSLKIYSEQLEEMVEARTKDLQDTQEQLIRREKLALLGQLASGVGHELRNPLGVISNSVYLLKMIHADADEMTKEHLEMISSRVSEAEHIVSDLLDFSRVRPAHSEKIALIDLITDVLERQPAPETVEVKIKMADDMPAIHVDNQQLKQVLINLVINAYQAMPEGGTLTVKGNTKSGQVQLAIGDSGYGMSAEIMDKIFEPLFTTKPKGIGLGLALSKNLIKTNGGEISVESTPEQGSTFTITLPTNEVDGFTDKA